MAVLGVVGDFANMVGAKSCLLLYSKWSAEYTRKQKKDVST